ncbi:MAG: hypothetical protein AAGF87_00315 [Bacteroidota bacterium]
MKSTERFQAITAIAVTIISLCALVVSIYQTKLLSEQQALSTKAEKAQLWPYLNITAQMSVGVNGYKSLALVAVNEGVGPAIIDEFSILFEGENIGLWINALEMAFGEEKASDLEAELALTTNNPLMKGQVIRAGEQIKLFSVEPLEPGGFAEGFELFTGDRQPTFKVVYRSVFDDKWQIESRMITLGEGPKPLQ